MILIPVLGTIFAALATVLVAWLTVRGTKTKTKADATAVIVDTALELIEPFRQQVKHLEERVARTDAALGDVQRQLLYSNSRVAALELQVRSLGHIPVAS